ncbi:hypothetical protein VTN02DRAFT_2752 [Thermoascus thermophilus]
MPPIAGHSVLVIGGTSGIGFAVAKLVLAAGAARVAIASSTKNRVESALQSLQSEFPDVQITGHECDLSHDDVEDRLRRLFVDVTGTADHEDDSLRLDHIIYTAGRPVVKPIHDISLRFIHQSGHVSFVAPLLVAKLAPRFIKSRYTSSLIFTTGRISEKPTPGWSLFASFATGLHGMTRNLAVDLKPVRVNLVSPGATDTEIWGANRENIKEAMVRESLLGKVGTAEEVAEAYLYLMKDTNATGACVSTSGGILLQ